MRAGETGLTSGRRGRGRWRFRRWARGRGSFRRRWADGGRTRRPQRGRNRAASR
nr:MAG TPA: hypothetical protein [Caudoviricetes sp.]